MGQMAVVASGTYAAQGSTLKMTQTSMTVNGHPAPASVRLGQGGTAAFKVDSNSLTLTPPGGLQPLTLTRVKQ